MIQALSVRPILTAILHEALRKQTSRPLVDEIHFHTVPDGGGDKSMSLFMDAIEMEILFLDLSERVPYPIRLEGFFDCRTIGDMVTWLDDRHTAVSYQLMVIWPEELEDLLLHGQDNVLSFRQPPTRPRP